jgi:hypothetical protein
MLGLAALVGLCGRYRSPPLFDVSQDGMESGPRDRRAN